MTSCAHDLKSSAFPRAGRLKSTKSQLWRLHRRLCSGRDLNRCSCADGKGAAAMEDTWPAVIHQITQSVRTTGGVYKRLRRNQHKRMIRAYMEFLVEDE